MASLRRTALYRDEAPILIRARMRATAGEPPLIDRGEPVKLRCCRDCGRVHMAGQATCPQPLRIRGIGAATMRYEDGQ
jgi:hypothetical protein